MRYNILGNTGLYVSELCLGTMTFGGNGGIWENIGKLQIDDVPIFQVDDLVCGARKCQCVGCHEVFVVAYAYNKR